MERSKPGPFSISPPNETAHERLARQAREQEAKWVSDEIDAQLRAERLEMRSVIRVMLLGQSESDKLTLMDKFRMMPSETISATNSLLHLRFKPSQTSITSSGDDNQHCLFYVVPGGSRARPLWLLPGPYFGEADALIFLAPISPFNEYLVEDPRRNRLEDSFLHWKSILSSGQLTRSTTVILIFSKCDILKQKLESGISVKKYVPSYGDRPNDVDNVITYLRHKFMQWLKRHHPALRASYFYTMSSDNVTEIAERVLSAVKDTRPTKPLPMANPREETAETDLDAVFNSENSISCYSLASSRTQTTDYGHYYRRMAVSQTTFDSLSLDDQRPSMDIQEN